MERIIGLVGLYKRHHFQEKETGVKLLNKMAARMEPRPVSTAVFEKLSVPMFNSRGEEGFVVARSSATALGWRPRQLK